MKKIKYIGIICSLFIVNNLTGQFNNVPASGGLYWRSNVNVGGIGIGSGFTLLNPPMSTFHINSNQTAAGTLFLPDETFRTSSPGTNNAAWRMFTGAGAGNGTARASFYTQPNDNVFT